MKGSDGGGYVDNVGENVVGKENSAEALRQGGMWCVPQTTEVRVARAEETQERRNRGQVEAVFRATVKA